MFSIETTWRRSGSWKRIDVVDRKWNWKYNVYLMENKWYSCGYQANYIRERYEIIKLILKRWKNYWKKKWIRIDKKFIDEIRELINSEILEISKLWELEESYISDWVYTTIKFSSIDKKIGVEFWGSNLWAFEEWEGRWPGKNVMKVLWIVKRIKRILIDAWIDEEYFRY